MLRVINMIENEQEQKIFNLSLFAILNFILLISFFSSGSSTSTYAEQPQECIMASDQLKNTYDLDFHGMTYPIKYNITGGMLNSLDFEPYLKSLLINISSVSNGTFNIELERDLIDSKKSDGKTDEDYSIWEDGQYTERFNEISSNNQTRTLAIDFDHGVEQIEISGSSIFQKPFNNMVTTNLSTYENPDFKIKMQYPPVNWTASELNLLPHNIVNFITHEKLTYPGLFPQSIPVAQVNVWIVSIDNINQNLTLDKYINFVLADSKENAQDFKFINCKSITLSNNLAYEILRYDYRNFNHNHTHKSLVAFTIKDNTLYYIEYFAEPGMFLAYSPDVMKMIDSFKIIQ